MNLSINAVIFRTVHFRLTVPADAATALTEREERTSSLVLRIGAALKPPLFFQFETADATSTLNIEQEVNYIAILHHIFLAFHPQQTGGTTGRF